MATKAKKGGVAIAKKSSAGTTNTAKKSMVKVVVMEDKGEWVRPEKGSKNYITDDAVFPEIIFEIKTQEKGPYKWSWSIVWDAKVSGLKESDQRGKTLKTFQEKGSIETEQTNWRCDLGGKIIGGTLTLEVEAGNSKFKRSIFICGTNPSAEQIKGFVDTLSEAKGYEKILQHEAHGKNFIDADGLPVVAFDKGYGVAQLTSPAPAYEQVWSWKENAKTGLALYQTKRADAKRYLSKHGKDSFTEEQLQIETYTRYNGGSYHEWDGSAKKWVRHPNILCDTNASNIGWNTGADANKGKSEPDLHKRDVKTYKLGKAGQDATHDWDYTGVCYAEHVGQK